MSFHQGLNKTAYIKGFVKGVGEMASGLKKGVLSTGKDTIGDTLKLKGFGAIPDSVKKSGGLDAALRTSKGREALGEGVGKAIPSAAIGGLYGLAAKKVYEGTIGKPTNTESYYTGGY